MQSENKGLKDKPIQKLIRPPRRRGLPRRLFIFPPDIDLQLVVVEQGAEKCDSGEADDEFDGDGQAWERAAETVVNVYLTEKSDRDALDGESLVWTTVRVR